MMLARRLMINDAPVQLDVVGTPSTYAESTGLATQFDVPLVSGMQIGELALMEFIANASPTVTAPSGAVTMFSASTPATYDSFRVFGKILDATDISNNYLRVTVNSAQRAAAILRRVTGNRPGLVLNTDYAVSAEALAPASTTADPPSLTPAWGAARNLWVAMGTGADSNSTFTSYASGYGTSQANIAAGSAGNGCWLASSCKLANLSTDDPGVITWGNSKARIGLTVAIRPR